jgi:hypothetical protein
MPKFLIERQIPGAGKLSPEELRSISQRSRAALDKLGTKIQWIHSYVTDDKIYCVYLSPDVETIQAHADSGKFPVNGVMRIATIIEPATAE